MPYFLLYPGKFTQKNRRSMEERMRVVLFVVMLFGSCAWACCGAAEFADLDDDDVEDDHWSIISNIAPSFDASEVEWSGKPDACALCQEYASKALDYLNENKTRTEIIDTLHNTCSQLPSFEQKCITLVDYYAPLLFFQIATIQPEQFCDKVKLCRQIAHISLQFDERSCEICKDTVSMLLDKLKDPDTELEIIEILLKVCSSVEKYADKCKRMVYEYGPLVFINAEKFLETADLCTAFHACKADNHKPFLSDS